MGRCQAFPRLVVTGEHDVFLPAGRLVTAVRGRLGTGVDVVPGTGHLVVEERPDYLSALLERP
ncbi:MAG: hypothetical protein H5T76_25880 [Streptomyces sp.]|nr:hypothetical protein [Streptomyces sp.]